MVSSSAPGVRYFCRSTSASTDSGMVSDRPTVAVVGGVNCTALAQANLGERWEGVEGLGERAGVPTSSKNTMVMENMCGKYGDLLEKYTTYGDLWMFTIHIMGKP